LQSKTVIGKTQQNVDSTQQTHTMLS